METGCVGMQVQHCAGQLFITITQYQRWSTYKQKFGVCSQFWSFQSMVIWFHAIGHVARQQTHRIRTKSFTASPGSKREWVPTSPFKDLPSTFKRHLTGPHFLKVSSWDSPILTHAPRWTSRFVQLSGQTTVKWRHFRDFGHQEHHIETTHMVTSLKKLTEGNRLLILTCHSIRHNKKFTFNTFTLRKYARDHQLFPVSHVMT